MKSESKKCQNCKKDFTIDKEDFNFYEKINVPPPTFCPGCRRQRRWAWRNNMSLYSRQCGLCNKTVVSIYSSDSPITVYCNKCWWSDKWDPKSYGREYDFKRPFFEQFNELMLDVPHVAVVNDDGIASLNCEYTHDWWFSKNCYMCLSGWNVENVMYSFFILQGKNIVDSLIIRTTSEWLYECFIVSKSYQMKYSELSLSCVDSAFLYDCRNCSECFMCAGLRGKKYNYKNKQYSKEEYEKILESYRLDTYSGVQKARKEFDEFLLDYPRKCPENLNCVNTIGEFCSFSKNLKQCFYGKSCQNCAYSEFFGDATNPDKDSYDITMTGGISECYECVVADHSQLNMFALFSVKSQDLRYTMHCHNCKHCFGCVGLRDSKYCIFNKQYTKEEYEELVSKIIGQMNEIPYTDKNGSKYRFGEYYPIELSPFGYNETNAHELISMREEEAKSRGYKWQNNVQKTTDKGTLKREAIPESVNDVQDAILEEILTCVDCARNYKIMPNELGFYRKMEVPIPRKCFFCRHADRMKRRNPFKLWHRECVCRKEEHGHEGKCRNEFETGYAPERPEKTYCEPCYQKEVY